MAQRSTRWAAGAQREAGTPEGPGRLPGAADGALRPGLNGENEGLVGLLPQPLPNLSGPADGSQGTSSVSRDRVIADFPKWYTPEACLQLKDHFHGQVRAACRERRTGTVGLKVSKVVVLGDLYVGKTSLINRSAGGGGRVARFVEKAWGAPQRGSGAIPPLRREGPPAACAQRDPNPLLRLHVPPPSPGGQRSPPDPAGGCGPSISGPGALQLPAGTAALPQSGPACERTEMDAVQLANEMQAEYWSVSAKTGENVKAFFSRVAALAFEQSVLQELERRGSRRAQIGAGASISIGMEEHSAACREGASASSPGCC
ncbi:ras-related protein Rab-34-like [Sarcophilus harrisii]|uniref:ras-related protein Rab-34-like n=1 Tax=Sarcophilus harrisii TaxID=9305 RepID=UPI001301AC5D|nr:ras-related protein Rab-34-like [Sarcophilus harrisii]